MDQLSCASLSPYLSIFTNQPSGFATWCNVVNCVSCLAGFEEDQFIHSFIMVKMMNNS
jgi:hypothetical protein